MLILIHGEDTVTSRKKLSEEKIKFEGSEMIYFDGNKLLINDLILAGESSSMLFPRRVIIIENLLLGGLKKQKQQLIDYLTGGTYPHQVVLWEGKEIEKSILKKYFGGAKQILCKYPSLLFRFLESIGKVNSSIAVSNFHSLMRQFEVEFLYVMVVRQWRNLILVKDLDSCRLSVMPSWQIAKYREQANYFSLTELVNSYRQLLAIDYKIKSGQTPYSLIQLLDIFFLNL